MTVPTAQRRATVTKVVRYNRELVFLEGADPVPESVQAKDIYLRLTNGEEYATTFYLWISGTSLGRLRTNSSVRVLLDRSRSEISRLYVGGAEYRSFSSRKIIK